MHQALEEVGNDLEECLPYHLREAYKLLPVQEALEGIHFPKSAEHVKQARRRFVYEELLLFQLKMQAIYKGRDEQNKGLSIAYNVQKLKDLISPRQQHRRS